MNVVLIWLFLFFFFGFVVALVLCVKPAPEQQRLDDAIGFLRDHAEVRIAEFQFPPSPPPFFKDLHFSHVNLRMLPPVSRSHNMYIHMSVALFADYAFD